MNDLFDCYTPERLQQITESTSEMERYHIQTSQQSEFSEGFLTSFEGRWIVINSRQTLAYDLPSFTRSFNREKALLFLEHHFSAEQAGYQKGITANLNLTYGDDRKVTLAVEGNHLVLYSRSLDRGSMVQHKKQLTGSERDWGAHTMELLEQMTLSKAKEVRFRATNR